MASGTDYAHEYGQAEKAYMQGNYQEAAAIVDRLIEDFPEDPSVCVYYGAISIAMDYSSMMWRGNSTNWC